MERVNKEQINKYLNSLKEIAEDTACDDCRLKDDCDKGESLNMEDTWTFEIEAEPVVTIEDGGLYLTKDEIEWLRCELECLNMMSEDKDIAQEALRLSGALDYIFTTQVFEEDEE